jgi:hypothetical protein
VVNYAKDHYCQSSLADISTVFGDTSFTPDAMTVRQKSSIALFTLNPRREHAHFPLPSELYRVRFGPRHTHRPFHGAAKHTYNH